jgi:hypothetical protein
MPDADFERDPTLRLVTDALRAGPGSPEWRQAVGELRARDGGAAAGAGDEHALLYAVREHLASGREYRAVRPGAEFSRKLWGAIQEEESARTKARSIPTANLIAILSAAAIVAVVAVAAYVLTRGTGEPPPAPPQDLSRVYFVETAAEATFSRPPGSEWKTLGALPLTAARGSMRPAPATAPTTAPAPVGATTGPASGYVGGALVWDRPIAPGDPINVEVSLRLPRAGDDVTAQVFVTDDPTFSDDRTTTPSELVLLVRDREASVVLPGGRVAGEALRLREGATSLRVQLMFDATTAAADAGPRRLFEGAHGLSDARPRYVGVRFLSPAGLAIDPNDPAAPGVASIRVLTPKQP